MAALSKPPKPVYFPGLNAIRFYAAMSVLVSHVGYNFGGMRGQRATYALLSALTIDAQSAVSLFLVLSGFLITYLLLKEQSETGTVAIRRFYVRRALRIWPLYYLIALIGFVILPILLGPSCQLYSPSARQVVLVLFLLPNLAGPIGPLDHLWSIGLEQQFYVAWPWAVKHKTSFLRVVFGILILKVGLAPVVAAFNSDAMMHLFLSLRFECMAIGALGAYAYFHNHRALRLVYSPLTQAIVLAGVIGLALVGDVPATAIHTVLVSALFILLILNVSTNPRSRIRIENRLLNGLGRISYGIYMYHYPLLYIALFILRARGFEEGHLFNAVLYVTTIGGALVLAVISYRWFEAPFLRLKTRFQVVRSRR